MTWRPMKLTQKHIDLIDDYLKTCDDDWERMQKSESSTQHWWSESWENRLIVNLPSFVWLIEYYYEIDKSLEICEDTLHEWKKRWRNLKETNELYVNFSESCKRVLRKQQKMLLNWGISNQYNPVIAKMLLNVNHWYKEVDKKEVEHSWEIKNTWSLIGALTRKRDKTVGI